MYILTIRILITCIRHSFTVHDNVSSESCHDRIYMEERQKKIPVTKLSRANLDKC